jgi:hypothetical protein
MKENALSRIATPQTRPGRYRPDDKLLAFRGHHSLSRIMIFFEARPPAGYLPALGIWIDWALNPAR